MPSLHFKGKTFVENHHLSVPFRELRPVVSKGTTRRASLHDHLVVHGHNLAALKALLPTCHTKVKCIYIDPPYNTGNERWAYNDNVNSPMMQDWLGKTVDRHDLTRHDMWCCMMMPRLKLLRELLRQDGLQSRYVRSDQSVRQDFQTVRGQLLPGFAGTIRGARSGEPYLAPFWPSIRRMAAAGGSY